MGSNMDRTREGAADNKQKKGSQYCRVMSDLLKEDDDAVQSWRVFKIVSEFVAGFELLRQYGLAATFFGTARCNAGDDVYTDAEALAAKLSEAGFAIITGGGPGVMEAANSGAFKAGGHSVGLNIRLPLEQRINPFTSDSQDFDFFFARKVMLTFASEVYVYFPGGFGTLDEFFEFATLIQTKKIEPVPVILYDKEYWGPLLSWIEESLYKKHGTISKEDMDLYQVVDSVEEAYEVIMKKVDRAAPRQI